MELHQLEYAVTVEECLSITKAAARLFISQPSLSQQISKLEDELGFRLFVRKSRGIVVTADGERFCRQARQVLESMDRLKQCAKELKDKNRTQLNVGVITTRGDFGLRNMLGCFEKSYPGIKVVSYSNHSEGLLNRLHEGLLDAAIILCPDYAIEEQHLKFQRLFEKPLAAVFAAGSPYAKETEFDMKLLKKLPLFASPQKTRPDCTGNVRLITDTLASIGLKDKEFMEYGFIDEVIQRVSLGEGMVFLFRESIGSELSGKLCCLTPKPAMCMQFYLVAEDFSKPETVRLFDFSEKYYKALTSGKD